MILVITREVLAMAEGRPMEEGEHARFDFETYELYRGDELPPTVIKEALLTFPRVRRVDIQRAYVKRLNDRSIANQLLRLSDDEYWNKFWSLFDDDGFWSRDFMDFTEKFCLETVVAWCESNGIAYRLAVQ